MTPIDLPAGITNTVQVDSSAEALARHGRERNQQLEGYWRRKIQQHYHAQFLPWAALDTSSLESYVQSTQPLRAHLLEVLGGWEPRPAEARARVEYLGDMAPGKLYRVYVWVVEEVEMPALMLIPHEAEHAPMPAVICQHGYAGSPEWAMGFGTSGQQNYLNSLGHRLASAGYVVIAPQIVCSPPGVGQDRVHLDRLARLSGKSLLGFEMFELSRVVDYLQTRPEVRRDRIGMYGISQGGKSTLFLSALDTRIAAAVCSCYFNNRWNKMIEPERLAKVSAEEGLDYAAYLSLSEDDKFNPLAAPLFPDHLLGALVCPRPFMVEIGRYDPVIYWRDAVEEFERLRRTYDALGLGERALATVAQWGGHEIFYDDAKLFLDRWLKE
jgi:alpha/beta hydrolase family protein